MDQTNLQPPQPAENNPIHSKNIIFLLLFSIILIILSTSAAYFYFQSKKTSQPPTPSPIPTQLFPSPIIVPGETAGWKIYTSTDSDEIKYQISYPPNWIIRKGWRYLTLDSPDGQRININCPRTSVGEINLPNPYSWENNEGGYTVKYFKKITLNGSKGQLYIWSAPDGSGTVYTDLLRNTNPVVCTLTLIRVNRINPPYEEFISTQTFYNQILSTFKFLDQN